MFARSRRPEGARLPQGAEAALWSIVEVIPDPRNHLALTRDPTCEIRLSAAQIEAAAAAPVPAAAASPAPAPAPVVAPAQAPAPVGVRWAAGTAPVVTAEPGPQPGPTLGSVHDLPAASPATGPTEDELIRALFAQSA